MPFKEFSSFPESGSEEGLRQLALIADADVYRQLSETVRTQLFGFFKRSGISEPRIILLNMMLETKHPDLLESKKLDEIIDEMRRQILKQIMREDQKRKTPAKGPKPELILAPNPHRLLSAREVKARFEKLNVDVEDLMYDWENYYASGQFSTAVKKSMVLQEYALAMPSVTDQAMQAFEKAHKEGRINSFMIDDARVPDGVTLRSYERKTLKRFKQKYKHKSVAEAERFLNSSTLTPPIVRIVGFNRNETIFDTKNHARSNKQSPKEQHHSTMGLGTYIRLWHYMNLSDPEGLEMVTHYTVKGNRILSPMTIVLNNKTDEEGVLTIGTDPQDPRMRHSIEKTPAVIQLPDLFEAPIHIVTSDNLGMMKNNLDSRAIMHMETWPAPPPDDDIPF